MQANEKAKDTREKIDSLKEQLRRSRIERRRQAAEVQEAVCQAAVVTGCDLPSPLGAASAAPAVATEPEDGEPAPGRCSVESLKASKLSLCRSKERRSSGALKLKRTVQALRTYRETSVMLPEELLRRLEGSDPEIVGGNGH